jgi:beta-N-acetylhexosaminidase
MAIAAARSPSLVFDVAKATAEEMHAVGFNWNLAPVLDVNSDPRNPVIGVRSFGDDPRDVGRFGVTTAEGLHAGGVAGLNRAEVSYADYQLPANIFLDMVQLTLTPI